MSKRASGPPRRPRNPLARAVRMPRYRQRIERDRHLHPPPPGHREIEAELESRPPDEEKEPDAST